MFKKVQIPTLARRAGSRDVLETVPNGWTGLKYLRTALLIFNRSFWFVKAFENEPYKLGCAFWKLSQFNYYRKPYSQKLSFFKESGTHLPEPHQMTKNFFTPGKMGVIFPLIGRQFLLNFDDFVITFWSYWGAGVPPLYSQSRNRLIIEFWLVGIPIKVKIWRQKLTQSHSKSGPPYQWDYRPGVKKFLAM